MLAFLFGFILFLSFLALLIVSASFRKAVGVLFLLAVVGILWLQDNIKRENERYERERAATAAAEQRRASALESEREERSKLIGADQLEIRNASLSGAPKYFDRNTLTATVSNRSAVALAQLQILVRLYECAGTARADYANCEVIGEDTGWVEALVPAKQTRQMKGEFRFPNTPVPQGSFAWTFTVRKIRAN